jgi:nucleotide-binding universal stress UspA family protein
VLLRVAEERHADLIVVGALGRSERGFLIGSVSQKVKALAHADVLLVKRAEPIAGQRFRALLAVDGSPESLAAVRSFSEKLRSDNADVRIVHALDLPLTVWDAFADADDIDMAELPPPLREHTDHAITGALAILRERGIEASTEIRRGRAAEEILHVAERYHPHVIVMGSRGLSGLRALVVGSVTQRLVRHGQASVLVARSPAQRERQ